MDCAQIELVAYHLAAAEPAQRQAAERHLLECKACLETYLTLKRETDRQGLERPSDALRQRLRRDVEAAIALRPARGSPPARAQRQSGLEPAARSWLSRPIPLYQGLALVAAAAILGVVADVALRAPVGAESHESERVDTSRPAAQSLSIF